MACQLEVGFALAMPSVAEPTLTWRRRPAGWQASIAAAGPPDLLLRQMLPAQASVDDAMQTLVRVRDVVDRCPPSVALSSRPT